MTDDQKIAEGLVLRRLTASDPDLLDLAAQLNAADSEVSIKDFSEASLKQFIVDPSRFYLIASMDGELAGAVHGYALLHPTGVTYLYVDEVDTIKQYRRQGVAKAMMEEVFRMAKEMDASEVWLGTEHDNEPAKALYLNLGPTEIENGPIYSWKVK